MIGFCPLASGSKGNAIYLGSNTTKILIDAGISARLIVKRLKSIDVDIEEIDAILVSHEHADHTRGISILASKYEFYKEQLGKAENQKVAAEIISKFLGYSCQVRCIHKPEDNHLLKAAVKLGAKVFPPPSKSNLSHLSLICREVEGLSNFYLIPKK